MEFGKCYRALIKTAEGIVNAPSLARRNELVNELLEVASAYCYNVGMYRHAVYGIRREKVRQVLANIYEIAKTGNRMFDGTVEYYQGCGRVYLLCQKILKSHRQPSDKEVTTWN